MPPDTGELFSQFGRVKHILKSSPASLFFQTIFQAFKHHIETDSVAKFKTIGEGFFSRKNLDFDFVNQMTHDTGGVSFV